MKQVQEEHLCRDIRRIAQALEKIAKALPSAESEVPDINVGSIGTISRQVAIDMLDEQIELCNASLQKGVQEKDAYAIKVERASLMAYREKLECLPFVQPERKTGHWIEHENADIVDGHYVPKYECSCCHTWKHDDSDYCPDCGMKMCGTVMEGGEQE